MSRTLLLGRAGAGKTHRVLAAVRAHLAAHDAEGRFERFQVLVPTYSQAEHLKRRLLRRDGGLPALLDRGIGTFEQFAEHETGLRLRSLAPATVRDALVLAALEDDDFPDFRPLRRFPGFRRAVLRFVKEVKSAEPEPGASPVAAAAERLVAAAAGLRGAAGRKLEGMARALASYQRRLDAAGLLDHEDLLLRLLVRVREPAQQRLRLFALDGFSDLTQVQERIVQSVAAHADQVLVTLTGDPDDTGGRECGAGRASNAPFAASTALLGRLAAASALDVEVLREQHRFGGDLARVERRAAGAAVAPAAPDGSVRLLAGADPADEADRVARTCRRFCAEGVPRGDVLIVVRRLDGEMGERVLDALRRHRVPHRRSSGAPLVGVPAAASALRALRLLAGAAAPHEVLDALCAGDARDVPAAESDALHAAARPRGLTSHEALADVAARDRLRGVSGWLDALATARVASPPAAPADVARALLAGLPTLVSWSYEGAVTRDGESRAATDAAALRKVRDLVAEVVRAMGACGHAQTTPVGLVRALEAAALEARCPVRDERVDVVNVVDAEEARQWEAEAVIVCGLRMGAFPAGAREDLFVADHDRASVEKSCGVRLPARLDEALRRERSLFYAAVTRARSRLVLTASVAGDGGDPVLLSPFLETLREIFPEEQRALEGSGRTPGDVRPEPGEAFGLGDVERAALAALGERHRPGGVGEARAHAGIAVLQRLADDERGDLERAARARVRSGVPATLTVGGAAAAHMARPRPRSASSLGRFRQCAYQHFADKGLGLREPLPAPDEGLPPMTAGSIAHAALEAVHRAGVLTAAAAEAAFDAAWREGAGHLPPGITLAGTRAELRHAIVSFVVSEAAAPLAPGFTTADVEWRFGFGDGSGVVVPDDEGDVHLRGVIDRIDEDERGRAVVLDYKWSWFSRFGGLERLIAEGEDLQLPLYALAVEAARERCVVGAGYVTLKDGRVRWVRMSEDAPRAGRSDVDWTADAAARLAAVRGVVLDLDAGIRSGRIAATPRNTDLCAYCAYRDLCRSDEAAR